MLKNEHYRKLEKMMHSAPIVKLARAHVGISEGPAKITLKLILCSGSANESAPILNVFLIN